MKIGFSYNLKDHAFDGTDIHAEYETQETIDAITAVLSNYGDVLHLPCDALLPARMVEEYPAMVFNIAEGWGGRDRESFTPALAAMLGIPCTGSDAVALGVTMDKALTKRVARDIGVVTAAFTVYTTSPDEPPSFGFPAFLKPTWDGSSRGVFGDSLVADFPMLKRKVEEILDCYHQPVMVEPYLDGRDFCVALLGNSRPMVLPTCEVLLGHYDGIPFFSREYKTMDTDCLDMHPSIAPETIRSMESDSLMLWEVLGLKDYARLDFRTDSNGTPFFLEINALPGLSPVSGIFVRQAAAYGFEYKTLIEKIMERTIRSAGIMT